MAWTAIKGRASDTVGFWGSSKPYGRTAANWQAQSVKSRVRFLSLHGVTADVEFWDMRTTRDCGDLSITNRTAANTAYQFGDALTSVTFAGGGLVPPGRSTPMNRTTRGGRGNWCGNGNVPRLGIPSGINGGPAGYNARA